MKTEPHHKEGKKCLIEIHNSKTKKSDFVMGKITGITQAMDGPEYRINVETESGKKILECHPDCIKRYYYISARSAWDTVPIGPFKSIEEAEKNYSIEWPKGLIKEA